MKRNDLREMVLDSIAKLGGSTKKGELKSVSEYKNVYNDLMRGTFTAHTGMYTSLF